jgi:hypothetical protein
VRRPGSVLGLVLALSAPGCTCRTDPAPTPTEAAAEACAAVPQVALQVPEDEVRTPVPIAPDKSAIQAAKLLKDLVYTHARDPDNPWAISHALLALGTDFELENGADPVDHLFTTYAEPFEVCGETLLRFPRKDGDTRIEPHTDLILKALTEARVPPDRTVQVGGRTFTVADLYRGSLHRAWVAPAPGTSDTDVEAPDVVVPYGPPSEGPGSTTDHWNDTPWALQGLVTWAPEDLSWTAEGGHAMSLDRFTHAAVERLDAETQALQVQESQGQAFDKAKARREGGLVSMTCGGMHMLQGTAHALAHGYGEPGDRARYDTQVQLLFWRYQAEVDTIDTLIQQRPRYRSLLLMQRLKFLGHFLETTHTWAAVGLLQPTREQEAVLTQAAAQLVATVYILHESGLFPNLGKMVDTDTPPLYPGVTTNEQLYLDYVGDSAHAFRGLSLALGHGTIQR